MLKDSLLDVQASYEPVLSVEDAVVGSEEYFPPIQEEQEPEEESNGKTEGERKDSKDMTEDVAKALAKSTVN